MIFPLPARGRASGRREQEGGGRTRSTQYAACSELAQAHGASLRASGFWWLVANGDKTKDEELQTLILNAFRFLVQN